MSEREPFVSDGGDQALLAQRLREAREVLGLTQEEVAAALGMQRTSVSGIESVKRNVSATELARLASLYRRSVDWLLGKEEQASPDTAALLRTTRGLSQDDQQQVLRFAQFLANAGSPPDAPGSV